MAGPVTAAAVAINLESFAKLKGAGVKDSKTLTQKRRSSLAKIIKKSVVAYTIVSMDHAFIDRVNILQATRVAMLEALHATLFKLQRDPSVTLVDGDIRLEYQGHQQSVIKGDQKSIAIAAASILAKVERDNWMIEEHKVTPYYDWNKNKGYGSPAHLEGLKLFGISNIHRRTFGRVKELVKQEGEDQ